VAQQIRDLHAQRPEFRLARLTWDFQDVLATAQALRHSRGVHAQWIGTARRAYADIGSLSLSGLFTEPVVSAGGYAGAVTYLVDDNGVIWSLGDVAPGGVERCLMAYVTSRDLGEVSVDPRTLCRSGLYLQQATAAANRRLGTGQRLSASDADGSRWSDPPLWRLWETPFETQLDRCWAARDAPPENRRAGDDFVFLRCTVMGAHQDTLLLATDSREPKADSLVLRGVAPSAHAELAYRRNLGVLARSPGVTLLVIGRIVFSRPRTLQVLAVGTPPDDAALHLPVGAPPDDAGLHLPDEWTGRVNLGLDRLQSSHIRRSSGVTVANSSPPRGGNGHVDPLDPLERRLRQILLGGSSTLAPSTWSGFARDEALLSSAHMPTAVNLLRQLREAPLAEADAQTRRTHLAQAWLTARTYLTAAQTRLQRLSWLS
jgi:hypothetical protein